MHNAIPLIVASLIAAGIIVIGCFYLASPKRVLGSFGLKPPASDADTLAWLRLKGIRDVVAGLAVLTLMLTTESRTVGIIREARLEREENGGVLGTIILRAETGNDRFT